MMPQGHLQRNITALPLLVATAALAIGVFIADTVAVTDPAFPALYIAVVLMAARSCRGRNLMLITAGCIALLILSYLLSPPTSPPGEALLNLLINSAVIGLTTFLVLQNQSAQAALHEKASLLDLTHDTVFVRDMKDVIAYWNRGAEELYGWAREEAIGKVTHQLTKTVFPAPLDEINAQLLGTGRWDGELIHTKRDGAQIVVASRWALQRDGQGRPTAILETNNDITDRKRAEEALRQSEQRYRNIFETAGVSIWEEDFSQVEAAIDALKEQGVRDFRQYFAVHPEFVRQAISMVTIIDVNHATLKLFGASDKEELLGALHTIFTPETHEAFVGELIAIAEGRIAFSSETQVQTLKGDKLAVLFTITFPPPPARLDSVLVTLSDITQRKQAEEALRESQEQWKAVFENNPTMYFMVDATATIMSVNPFGAEQLGYEVNELIGRPVQSVFHEADREAAQRNTAICFEQLGQAKSWELRKIRKDGEVLWVRETARAMLMKGRPVVLIVCEDITERKRAEYLTGQVFESSPHGISIVERNYRYRRVNPVYERRWEMPAERFVGMHVSELVETEVFDGVVKPNLDRCFAGEEVIFAGWFSDHGDRQYLAVTFSPLRLGSERVEAALVINHDLTEHMRATEALQAAQAELAHVARMSTLGELAASIAHEVNQPLTAIVTGASAALRWLDSPSPSFVEAREAFADIQKDGNRAADVISRIRALASKSPIRMDRLGINDVILEVIALTRSEMDRNRIALRTRLADHLPAIRGDKVQLQQVILNLIVNAMEAMHEDRRRELLISSSQDDAQNVLVSVCDSGPGLAPDSIDRIFDSFYTTKSHGMGMGLSICRSIIEVHGGQLTVRPNMPRGAIFEFSLPSHAMNSLAPAFPLAKTAASVRQARS
jgi:PAS domain S-box-containing protein